MRSSRCTSSSDLPIVARSPRITSPKRNSKSSNPFGLASSLAFALRCVMRPIIPAVPCCCLPRIPNASEKHTRESHVRFRFTKHSISKIY